MFLSKILIFTILCSSLNAAIKQSGVNQKPYLQHSHGKPINLLTIEENGTMVSNYDSLNKLFTHPEVKDRKIAVVSIVGAFRKGKSFFLDYCLRFLYANYKSVNYLNNPLPNKKDWMGKSETPLSGFSWKSGIERDTSGIIIWSDIFLYENDRTGEKFAIALIDTQGLFDTATSSADNQRIFSLGTLMSSTQIVNINGNIQEDQLQYLQLATDYAKLATQNSAQKPFQHLMFLIRDWNHLLDHELGLVGGEHYIKKVLKISETQDPQLRSVREYIYDTFETISCFLMPTPPLNIMRGIMKNRQVYDGRHSEMDQEFKDSLKEAVESVFLKENIHLKQENGEGMTALRYKELIEEYLKYFTKNDSPKAELVYEINVNKHMDHLIEDLVEQYETSMHNFLTISDVNLESNFEFIHSAVQNLTIVDFESSKKMGTREHATQFKKILMDNLNEKMKNIKNDILTKQDELLLWQKHAAIAAQHSDETHKLLQQKLAEISIQWRALKRKEADMDPKVYFKKYQELNENYHSIEQQISFHDHKKEIERELRKQNEDYQENIRRLIEEFRKQSCILWGLYCW